MKNDLRYLEIPLEEMQRDLNLQIGSFDVIKTTVRSVLSSASLYSLSCGCSSTSHRPHRPILVVSLPNRCNYSSGFICCVNYFMYSCPMAGACTVTTEPRME